MNFDKTITLVEQAIQDKVFPCAAIAIGKGNAVYLKKSFGNAQLFPEQKPLTEQTLFDMASLSKVIGTTMVAFQAIQQGKLCLDDTLSRFFENPYDKADIRIQNLLTHSSGIASHMPLWLMNIRPDQAIDTILKQDLAYKTNTDVQYSCMGYIVLGNILEQVFGDSLDKLVQKYVFQPLNMKAACYCPTATDVVATEFSKDTGSYLKGVVHDENARFLGGVAGNAGVFATLDDMIAFTAMLSKRGKGYLSNRMFEKAIENYTHGMSENRGLGFALSGDVPNFAGDLFSQGSYGHTGFTGTSIMVDKETGYYAILLTNRVHYGRENNEIIRFRKQFHNSVWLGLDKI
ncbi:serine hydrolase domain-containing protein [Paludicola sp. MB14-C6]|uniref:serine hydrolase domain-containing protein n=1 Tax=Paludihabitans sp. MB14-C6 TaxID=3070656 RepID=UPI0027DE4FBC|nr:serine hydrolase domain-containing protein [Paludicola sp. MB14-C6]WMJ24385.1 serine hydrolase domain-containing protein [Paludicola sp. MB14-C6]